MRKVCGVGVNDFYGKVSYIEGGKKKYIKSYIVWKGMLRRCYSDKFQEKHPTYIDCSVDTKWLLYSNFKKWFDNNYPFELSEDIKFELDKDLLVEGNKVYSEEVCIFLPKKINLFMTNKYSNNKTGYTGVDFYKQSNKFRARINKFGTGKLKHLGLFESPVLASEAYVIARKYMSLLAKQYTRDLNIYSEEVIEKIK